MSLRQLEEDLDAYTARRAEVAAFRAGLSQAQLADHDNRSNEDLGEVNKELDEDGEDMDDVDRSQLLQRQADLQDFGRDGLARIDGQIMDIRTEILRMKNRR